MKDALGAVQSILLLGGTSEIGLAAVRALLKRRPARIVLAGRDPARLEREATALKRDGAVSVVSVSFDALDTATHSTVIEEAFTALGDIDVAVVAFGILGDQAQAERDARHAFDVVVTNYVGAVTISVPLVERLRAQGHGTIVVLSSVAGERVRAGNFVYGSSKAGLDGYFQGLADSLVGSGVRVLVVRPGYVHGRMTAGEAPKPFATTPEAVGEAVARGLARGTDVVWVPPVLRFVMSVARHLPRPMFRRLAKM